MRKINFLLSFLITAFALHAQIIWDSKSDEMVLGNKLSVLEDPEGKLTFSEVSKPEFTSKFKLSEKEILNFGFTESFHWLKFSLNNTTGDELELEIAHAFLPVTELYYTDTANRVIKMEAGYKIPVNDKVIKHHFQVFPLQTGSHDYYIRVLSNSHPLPIRVFKKAASEIKAYRQKIAYGFYLGFMFFVMLSNIFFYFSLRNRLYLFYSFVVLLYVSYAAAVMDGFILYVFPQVDLMFWYITIPTIGVAVQMIYCISFLETSKYTPRLHKVAWGVTIYFIAYAIIKFFIPLTAVLAVNTVNALISFFMMGYIGYKVGKKGNKLGYYFASAYFIYFLLVLTEATYIQTGKPPYVADLSHVALATLIEAFILSYLLSRRFEWEKQSVEQARLLAQQKLVESTLENEKIVREQNIVLEKTVANRTQELQNTLLTVETERQKSESLLLNILPSEIISELKETGHSKARLYNDVSVLFTDFADFTIISEKISPEELVKEMDICFKAFDEIMDQNGLEKIKTIGDAYMAVCGLPNEDPLHAKRTVQSAIEIMAFIKKRKKEGGLFDIRIGVNSGSVVAGIVGVKKFAYDIWGDTVNTAARMEESSEIGKINISGQTYELVKADFLSTYRGKVEAKHKGMIDMYFVEALN